VRTVQPNIHLPLWIELGITAGKFIREGSVLRDPVSKKFVKLLHEVQGSG
jgi:hypothetical protein